MTYHAYRIYPKTDTGWKHALLPYTLPVYEDGRRVALAIFQDPDYGFYLPPTISDQIANGERELLPVYSDENSDRYPDLKTGRWLCGFTIDPPSPRDLDHDNDILEL
jgi:hypothetical protein